MTTQQWLKQADEIEQQIAELLSQGEDTEKQTERNSRESVL